MSFLLRDAGEQDTALVGHSWLTSYYLESPDTRGISRKEYFAGHGRRLDRELPRSTVRVACDPETPWLVFGWMAHRGDCLHYAYVKAPFRRQGIYRALFAELHDVKRFSHRTRMTTGATPAIRLPLDWRYDPFAFEDP